MKTIDLPEILKLHKLWLEKHPDGKRADLSDADLSGADLRRACLSGANLYCADLRRADLSDAILRGADLRGADLYDADLSGADLHHANLSDADLNGADLSGADLHHANLRDADLNGADLRRACLSGANLSRIRGVRVAACHWTAHGEHGRLLNAVEIEGEVTFFCGCFRGNEQVLREYISMHNPEHASSRTKALEFLLSCF